jgi:aspartate racemase
LKRRRFGRIAIFGARVTMETRLFGALGDDVDVILPAAEDLDLISETYYRIVARESATPQEIASLRTLAHRLIAQERLDGILLAGTDWAFVFDESNADFPHVDGARAHIQAIMRELAPAPGRPSA